MIHTLLKKISEIAVKYRTTSLTDDQKKNKWLGHLPSSMESIQNKEQHLCLSFPADYVEFLLITNGFTAPNAIAPYFEKVEDIGFLKDLEPELFQSLENKEEMENSILIAGHRDEQFFFLAPPSSEFNKWRYFMYAKWQPVEVEFEDLQAYFQDSLEFMEEEFGK